jgi:hypothetical protein
MNLLKPTLTAAAVLTLIALASVHARCQENVKVTPVSVMPANIPPPIDAVVMPTAEEVQVQLDAVGQRLKSAENVSFHSPSAEDEYLDAQRMYKLGQYDLAADDLKAAQNALPDIPSWTNVKVVAHKD